MKQIEEEKLHRNEEENSGVRWFSLEEALTASEEPWMVEHIYQKLIQKMKSLKQTEML